MTKKRLTATIWTLLVLFSLLFAGHEYQKRAETQERIDKVYCTCISNAKDAFEGYYRTGDLKSYHFGVNCLYTMTMIYQETSFYNNQLIRNLHSACVKATTVDVLPDVYIPVLVQAFTYLSESPENIGGYITLGQLDWPETSFD